MVPEITAYITACKRCIWHANVADMNETAQSEIQMQKVTFRGGGGKNRSSKQRKKSKQTKTLNAAKHANKRNAFPKKMSLFAGSHLACAADFIYLLFVTSAKKCR